MESTPKSKKELAKIYENRKLADGFPEIEDPGVAQFSTHQATESRMPEAMRCDAVAVEPVSA